MALAMMPPISKKLPAVAAVPIRKKRASSAAVVLSSAAKTKLAQTMPRQQILRHQTIVSRRETAMGDDSMLPHRLQPDRPVYPAAPDNGCSPSVMSGTVA